MATRYVRSGSSTKKGAGPDAFTDPSRAASRLTDAIQAAAPGDVVRILDNAVYAEGEIHIDKPLTIESAAANGKGPLPVDKGFVPTMLPRLRPVPGRKARVVRVQSSDKSGKQNAVGKVVLRGLTIENGQTTNSKNEVAQGDGAGIVVVNEDDVTVESCCLRNNVARSQALGKYSTVPFKQAIMGAVQRMVQATGLSLAVNVRPQLDQLLPDMRDNSTLFAQASGGGIALLWSSGTIRKCLVDGNSTGSRGGGIAVIGYGWPRLEDCIITNNKSGVALAGHRDGGGLAVEISIPEKLGPDLTEQQLMDEMTIVINNVSGDKLLGMVGLAVVKSIGSQFSEVVMYKFASLFLNAIKDASWNAESVAKAKKRVVGVNRCRFTGNESGDDGGGIYASVLSRIGIEASSFEKNRALNGLGGGVRSSMGSDTTITGCSFSQNSSEGTTPSGVTDPTKMSRSGGGAIAGRNITLDISGGSTPTTIEKNWTAEFAGGGLLVENSSEGSMAGVPHLWHAILKQVFSVDRAPTTIGAGVTITDNTAGAKQRAAGRGKGGGIYLLRDSLPDAPDLDVTIQQFAKQVRGNRATAGAFKSRLTGESLSTSEIDLVDIPAKVDDGDVQVRRKIGSSGAYRYSS